MPEEWQQRFVELLKEARRTYDTEHIDDRYTVLLRGKDGRFVEDPLANYRHPPKLPYAAPK